jgi:hypothetical protein
VTADQRALALFEGAATTVLDYAASFRQVGWRSLYCLVDPTTASRGYHDVVVQELLALFTITCDARFARLADGFENDYPRDAVSGKATLAAGTHPVFKFVTPGQVAARSAISSKTTAHVKVSRRRRIQGLSGYWLEIAGGACRGYWIQEWAAKVFVPGELVVMNYSPTRTLTLPAGGRYVFHHYAPDGTVTSTMVLTVSNDTTIQVNTRAIVNGMPQVCASGGTFAGYWIRLRGCSLT